MIILYIFIIILGLFVIASIIPIRCNFSANTEGTELKVRYLFFKYTLLPAQSRKEKPKPDKPTKTEGKTKKIDVKKTFAIIKEAKDDILKISGQAVRYIAKHAITLENFNISAKIGTGDPADTGMICGAAYSVVYQSIGVLVSAARLKDYNVLINPDFDNSTFSAGVHIRLRTRLVHLLILAVFLLRLLIKYKRTQTRYERSLL